MLVKQEEGVAVIIDLQPTPVVGVQVVQSRAGVYTPRLSRFEGGEKNSGISGLFMTVKMPSSVSGRTSARSRRRASMMARHAL